MKKKRLVICALLSALLLNGCRAQATVEIETVVTAVEVTEIKPEEISSSMVYAGRINASSSLSVASKLSGKVSEVFFDIGDTVKEGDVLFTLDETDLRNQIRQLEASVRTADTGVASAQASLSTVKGGQYDSQLRQLETQIENYEKQLENGKITLENAQIAMRNAEDGYKNASDTYENTKILYEAGVVTKSDFERAELGYNQAKSGVESAQNAYEQARIGMEQIEVAKASAEDSYTLTTGKIASENVQKAQLGVSQAASSRDAVLVQLDIARSTLEDTSVTAPMSGVISGKNAKAGEFTSTQIPAYTIVDIDKVNVEVKVSELLINKLHTGLEVEVGISALNGETKTGKVITVSPAADVSGTYPVSIEIDNTDGVIKPGMFAEVRFIREKSDNTIVLPRNTLLTDETSTYVYINDNGVARRQTVTTGIDNGKSIEIQTGLKAGDQVITKGQNYVSDGEPIKIVGTGEEAS